MRLKRALVLLTYNEFEALPKLFDKIPLSAADEVFAVDGGSKDGTVEYLQSKGVKVLGPLPAPIANATAYAAGIMAGSRNREAAERFIATLTAPAQRATWIAMGFEPAGRD